MNLSKYYNLDCDDLNINFKGSYELLKFILNKYKLYCYPHPKNNTPLPQVTKFAFENCYSVASCAAWKRNNKVSSKAWNIVCKDLIMLRVTGKIKDDEVMTLDQLNDEFNNLKNEFKRI